jgi:C-terminal processing protease CtpA/Prc
MVGELRASHMGAYPGRGGHSEDGYIGLLFDRAEQASTGRLRITAIMPYSPAELAGSITIGDYLLAVNDIAISGNVSLDTLLERTVGRRVRLRIGQPGGESHEVAVRPISADQYNALRYRNWVYANEAYVHRVSNGRLGYVHIREMSYPAYQQFLADLDVEAHSAEGVVVDARFNGGGHTATFILDVLARRSVLLSTFRDRPATDAAHLSGNRVLNKPTVLVINEGSGSNTEMFAEGYRRMGLGKIVGRPTAGAVIWTHDRMLLDGTRFRLPSLKVATPEGEDLEGTGRAVDIDVTLPLGASARGQDTQLDAAVAALLEQIDES